PGLAECGRHNKLCSPALRRAPPPTPEADRMSGSKIIGGAIAAVGRAMALPMPRNEGEKARAFAAERLAPAFVHPTPNGPIRFACDSRMAYRAVSMAFRNEPETI